MVSRVPTFSGKKYGGIQREWVVPILIGVVILAMLLVSYPFHVLSILTILYLAYIPFGWRAWNRLARAHGTKEDELTLGRRWLLSRRRDHALGRKCLRFRFFPVSAQGNSPNQTR